jgi:hypothetical protein
MKMVCISHGLGAPSRPLRRRSTGGCRQAVLAPRKLCQHVKFFERPQAAHCLSRRDDARPEPARGESISWINEAEGSQDRDLDLMVQTGSPLANGFAFLLRDFGVPVDQHIFGVGHLSIVKFVANFFEFVILFVQRIVAPVGKIHLATRFVNIVRNYPRDRRNVAVPRPTGLVVMAVVAGTIEDSVNIGGNRLRSVDRFCWNCGWIAAIHGNELESDRKSEQYEYDALR